MWVEPNEELKSQNRGTSESKKVLLYMDSKDVVMEVEIV